ncbi:peptidase M48 [Anaerobacillus arseniciselenatis]|uniref:Peptidase M48 n=1 Tax=Anaerobacillus arseniciselenatis TaxID=85682 RepID=A0A1S2LER9_9BACI|nr:M48 family metallopeptidase [Anaerobacillus arseniciselenatis]OIJ10217.1 peptidase M48 [Anaerobacillus arseniciselenatis]
MKKVFFGVVIIYALYAVAISTYLFTVDTPLPEHYIGTEADPQTFMDEEQLMLSQEFSKWRNVLYFVHTPFEWMIYLFVLCFGLSRIFARWSEAKLKFRFLQTAIYVILLSSFSWLVSFPIKYFSYSISKDFGISIQPFHNWMRDQLVSFWVGAIILTIIAYVIMLLISKSPKKWWFYTWLLSIPFTLFLMFIQPVVVDPLYHDFYPIKDKELETEILQLANKADIPADRVYEVTMSDKTNSLNAYVTGIGSNLRIVLWDTTLEKLTKDEVLFVMAHEMGHYDLKHLQLLLLGSIVASFVALYITSKLYSVTINNLGKYLNIKKADLAALPIILLIFSLLSFVSSPFSNAISRAYEYQSDRYAIDLTEDADAAVSTFHKLSVEGLADVNPPTIVKILRYTHPPMVDRITHIRQYSEKLE